LLAQRGAEVWAIDISPRSVALTQHRAEIHEVEGRVHPAVMSAIDVDYPDGFFDRVHGQDTIHHVDAYLFRFRHRGVSRLCTGMDGAVHRCVPFLRPYSYRQLICCRAVPDSPVSGSDSGGRS
jgi:SAM-dependent methyltransferase